MKKLETALTTRNITEIFHEEEFNFNAPHSFEVRTANQENPEVLLNVHFQEGPIAEHGVNGIFNEDLIAMVISRLDHFNKSEYACEANAVATYHLESALIALRNRTNDRAARGVLGTSNK